MILSKTAYKASVFSLIPDNSHQLISPEDIRTSFINLADSVSTFIDIESEVRTTRAGAGVLVEKYYAGRSSVDNTAFGYFALHANHTGGQNTAVGSQALSCNINGSHNVAVGTNTLAGNTVGSGNVGLGNFSLQTSKKGDFNIGIGHGAGYTIGEDADYKFYVASYAVDSDSLCDAGSGPGPIPLLYGDLKRNQLKLGVAVNSFHNYGTVQVSGDVSPSATGVFNVGNSNFPWKSVNETIYFSGGKVAVGQPWPSGEQGIMTVKGNIVPDHDSCHSLGWAEGGEKLLWDGYFNDILVSGNAIINDIEYHTIKSCVYDCKTLHLATSGLCGGGDYGFHNSNYCGYLSDQSLDGAGFEIHSSGSDYQRDYRLIYKFPDLSLTCLEKEDHYSRSRWQSNISLELTPGRHLQTDRVLGDSKMTVATQSGCYGLFFRTHQPSGNKVYITSEPHVSGIEEGYFDYNTSLANADVSFIGHSGTTILPNGAPSGYDFSVLYGSVDSGVSISQKFATRIKDSTRGFGLEYHDDISDATDRLSAHVYNGQSGILEAFTVLRSGGTVEQSGLFGITNWVYPSSSAPILPETIFNVQASGGCDIRFSSTSGHLDDNNQWYSRTSLELLGNGNARSSGLHISYDPGGDNLLSGKSIVDFSLIRPRGKSGLEAGFMSVSESGFVGIGSTKHSATRLFDVNAPLTISYSGDASLSGTVSLKEQGKAPEHSSEFGKIYVKPFDGGDWIDQTQSLNFQDDEGNEFNITSNTRDTKTGLLHRDLYGNTYGGFTPEDRRGNPLEGTQNNTFVGYGAGYHSSRPINSPPYNYSVVNGNTLLGHRNGFALEHSSFSNTVIGSTSLSDFKEAQDNVVIGTNNARAISDEGLNIPLDELSTQGITFNRQLNNCILIGTDLFYKDNGIDNLKDYTLAIGFGDKPLVLGTLGDKDAGSNPYKGRNFSLNSFDDDRAKFSIADGSHIFSIMNANENNRELTILDIQNPVTPETSTGLISIRSSSKVDLNGNKTSKTLVDIDADGTITNTPQYEPTTHPYVSVHGDIKLQGKLLFADGTSLGSNPVVDIRGDQPVETDMATVLTELETLRGEVGVLQEGVTTLQSVDLTSGDVDISNMYFIITQE